MRYLLSRRRARAIDRVLAATTFCDGCGGVCTLDERRAALRDGIEQRARQATLYRL